MTTEVLTIILTWCMMFILLVVCWHGTDSLYCDVVQTGSDHEWSSLVSGAVRCQQSESNVTSCLCQDIADVTHPIDANDKFTKNVNVPETEQFVHETTEGANPPFYTSCKTMCIKMTPRTSRCFLIHPRISWKNNSNCTEVWEQCWVHGTGTTCLPG